MIEQFDDNDFKDFLQTETNQHKLFPSDKVWRNIQQEIHGQKKWPALTIISIFVIVALTVSTLIYDHPTKNKFQTIAIAELSESKTVAKTANATKIGVKNNQQKSPSIYTSNTGLSPIEAANFTDIHLVNTTNTLSETIVENVVESSSTSSEKVEDKKGYSKSSVTKNEQEDYYAITISEIEPNQDELTTNKFNTITAANHQDDNTYIAYYNPTLVNKDQQLAAKEFIVAESDEFVNEFGFNQSIPKLIKPKQSKFEFQIYVTPSISYRKLVDDKKVNNLDQTLAANGPIAARYLIDVNDVVRHKPAMGTEVGVGMLYRINERLKFRTGVQFNLRKYYIDSYKSGLNIASIAIFRNNILDTIRQFSTLSANNAGYDEALINNQMFQISVPLGVEYTLIKSKKLALNVAASLQPTLTLNKNVYLISTDYKYYTDGTSFFRKWNINSSVELNLTYKVGAVNWFIGPQMRYQHLPTYNEKYPIKEYRMDYGLRFGFTKPI